SQIVIDTEGMFGARARRRLERADARPGRLTGAEVPWQRAGSDAWQLAGADVATAIGIIDEVCRPWFAFNAVIDALQVVVEEAHDFPGEIDSGRRNTVFPRPAEKLAAQVGSAHDHLTGRFVAPVAPEVRGNARLAKGVEVV